jgi:hypothetical protein
MLLRASHGKDGKLKVVPVVMQKDKKKAKEAKSSKAKS